LYVDAMFGIFSGFYPWCNKSKAHSIHLLEAKLHFLVTFINVDITFLLTHFIGLAGIPSRFPDYPDAYAT
jgi:cytochrome c oxidase subunit 1